MQTRGKSLSDIKAEIEACNHQRAAGQALHVYNSKIKLIRIYGVSAEEGPYSFDMPIDNLPMGLRSDFLTFIEHLCHYHQGVVHSMQAATAKITDTDK